MGDIKMTGKIGCVDCGVDFGVDPQGGPPGIYIVTVEGDAPVPDGWQVSDWPARHDDGMSKLVVCPHLDPDKLARAGWPVEALSRLLKRDDH
jgi:hypothetical protein